VLLVLDHPNKEQYDQYEQQWRQYEEQMSQKREYIQSRKQALLESQQQGQAAAAASHPAVPQPDSSIAAPVPSSAVQPAFSAPSNTDTSATFTAAMYGTGAATQLATSKPMESAYPPYPGGQAGQAYPMPPAPGYGGRMPFQAGAPYPPHISPGVPGGQRFPPAYPPANSGPGGPRPGFPGARPGFPKARPAFGTGQTPTSDVSENPKGFEQFGDGEDSAVGSQFLQGTRPPFEGVGARPSFGQPPFGQRFRGPRPGAPNEFGMQSPFQPNQPRAGFRPVGPRPGFGPRPDMYTESGETSTDVGEETELGDQTSGVPSSSFGPRFGGTGFVRGMRPGGPDMGPRAGFSRGPRPMGMLARQPAPSFLEGASENTEESSEWLSDGMQATSRADFGPRGMRPEGPRFTTPVSGFSGRGDAISGFSGRGDVQRPGLRVSDPRLMLRPGDPRAMMRGGLHPRALGPCPPWFAGSGRGVPPWGQNFGASDAEEEYDENAENQEGAEEDVSHEEGFGEDYEGSQDLEQGDVGFGNTGFGPHGFPHSQFGVRPTGFGMEHPRLAMRGPRPGFGPRGLGFGPGLRPRSGPVPLMDIRVRPPAAQPISSEESETGQEGEENAGDEETQGLTEESEQFAEQTDVATGIGARMPFRPPFAPGPRGFPPDQRLRPPGSMLGAPAGARGGRWPRPGFGVERMPAPGFRGPMHRFPRMPGQQYDSDPNKGYYPEGGGFDLETGFGDVSEDFLAAEAEQWGDEQHNKDGQSMKPPSVGDASERYQLSQFI